MKSTAYKRRFYRNWIKEKDLIRSHVKIRETDLQILTDKPINEEYIREKVAILRRDIEGYIEKDRRFLTSLKPIAVELNARPIIKSMSQASRKANVGPMAAVAGAIAEDLGKDLLNKGMKEVIIENGGDIFLKTKKTRYVGIYAGKSRLLSHKLFVRVDPEDSPLGICTSSGTVGHSLSFGKADAVIILAKNAAFADAAATACANLVNSKEDFPKAMDFARKIRAVRGIIIIINNNIACWGRIEFAK